MRKISKVAPEWWDYTTLDDELLNDAAKLTEKDILELERPGFKVTFYDTIQEFYSAEALEYITAWQQATEEQPAGICGPVGPTQQLPIVANIINNLEINLKHAHFWGMDEWVIDGKEVDENFPLGFKRADMEKCFNLIKKDLCMPKKNLHFPTIDTAKFEKSWEGVRCIVMQGGQGDVKHWAFNDPVKREGKFKDNPPSFEEYCELGTRIVDLHPLTVMQNTRNSCGGSLKYVPNQAITVGPRQTFKAEKVSIWHPGCSNDNPLGMRLSSLMISKKFIDSALPMSLLANHPNVEFSFIRNQLGDCSLHP